MTEPSLSALNNRTYLKNDIQKAICIIFAGKNLEDDKKLSKYSVFRESHGNSYYGKRQVVAQENCDKIINSAYDQLKQPTRTALQRYVTEHYIGVSKRFVDKYYAELKALEILYSSDDELKEVMKENLFETISVSVSEEEPIRETFRVGQLVRMYDDDKTMYKVTRERQKKHSLANSVTDTPVRGRTFFSYELQKI